MERNLSTLLLCWQGLLSFTCNLTYQPIHQLFPELSPLQLYQAEVDCLLRTVCGSPDADCSSHTYVSLELSVVLIISWLSSTLTQCSYYVQGVVLSMLQMMQSMLSCLGCFALSCFTQVGTNGKLQYLSVH